MEAETLTGVDKEDIQYEITVLEEKLAKMKPNMAAIAEYRKKVRDMGHAWHPLTLSEDDLLKSFINESTYQNKLVINESYHKKKKKRLIK